MLLPLILILSGFACMGQGIIKVQSDTMYCMPIWQARMALSDDLKKYEQDSLIQQMGAEIKLEKGDKNQQNEDFKELLKVEKEKNKVAEERRLNSDSVAGTWKAQADVYQKDAKKSKRGKNLALFGWGVSDVILIAIIISLL